MTDSAPSRGDKASAAADRRKSAPSGKPPDLPPVSSDAMDDAAVVARVLAGDREAFSDLVRRHQRWVTVVAFRSTRDLGAADDVAQEAFLRAYQALAGWRGEASFRTWLAQIVRNLLRDRALEPERREEPLAAAAEALAAEPGQEQALLDRETLDALRQAYAAIPPGRQREVVRMRFVEGRRLEEIAKVLGLRVGTVKAHLFRGSQKLRALLASPSAERAAGGSDEG
jgi:RNA polymerase sigma-70 factor (ECF subfamily)